MQVRDGVLYFEKFADELQSLRPGTYSSNSNNNNNNNSGDKHERKREPGIKVGFWFNLVLVLATQLTGFGLAGFFRCFLLRPASMVWPQNLVVCALLNTLHAEVDNETGGCCRCNRGEDKC